MGRLTLIVEIRVHDPAAFRSVADRAVEHTVREHGTLQYEWFSSDDGRRVIVIETFEDENAFEIHAERVAQIIAELRTVGEFVETRVLGDVDPERLERLSSTTSSRLRPYAGFRR